MSKLLQNYRSIQRAASLKPPRFAHLLNPECMSCASCNLLTNYQQTRSYQKPPPKKGLFGKFLENIQDGFSQNKQIQDNLRKFKEEKAKLDESDSLKDVKDRLSTISKLKQSASPYLDKLEGTVKESTQAVSSTLGKIAKEASESEVYKKGKEVKDELSKSAKEAASKISEQGEEIEKTQGFKTASTAFSKVREDLFDDLAKESRPYQRPEQLRRRTHGKKESAVEKEYEANEDAQDIVMHKDSKWQQQWKDFRDNNPMVTGLFTLKTKYDESDNVAIRATRVVTDKLTDIFSDVFSQSEQAKVISEITKIDPLFNKDQFIKECEFEIIPTVLEAYLRGDIEILHDWCHEGSYNVLSTQIKHNDSIGLVNASKILDIREVELQLAKIMEQGPVLILTFQAQQVMLVKDKRGKIVEGAIDHIENVNYVWAMCRDQSIFDHRSAWRVLEFGIQQATPYV